MPKKLEPENSAMIVIMFLEKSLDLILELDTDKIQNHNRTLSEKANLGLRDLGLELISPLDNVSRSGNACFLSEDARSVSATLAERKLLV